MTSEELIAKAKSAKAAARELATLSSRAKDAALGNIAEGLLAREEEILAANAEDVEAARQAGLSEGLIDRLLLTPERLKGVAQGVREVIALPDPVGEGFDGRTLPNGLQVSKRRVPIGVLGVIYEARPNVTVDIAALALKSGNAVILRGGSETIRSNMKLVKVIKEAIKKAGLPEGAVELIESTDRSLVREMLRLDAYIDMIIPRGGAGLHRFAIENATVPVITGGVGICHQYVDKSADLAKAVPITYNAKVQRPSVCNALDTLLVHREVAREFLPRMAESLSQAGVEFRCDEESLAILKEAKIAQGVNWKLVPAGPQDFDTEFLSLILAVKVVGGLSEAIEHIYEHSTGHSEAIITEDYSTAMEFLNRVDASAVFVNCSTRFNDGGQFGLGAEVAVSTQKLHARGPMALKELTTYKWIVLGDGQVRE